MITNWTEFNISDNTPLFINLEELYDRLVSDDQVTDEGYAFAGINCYIEEAGNDFELHAVGSSRLLAVQGDECIIQEVLYTEEVVVVEDVETREEFTLTFDEASIALLEEDDY